jgi:hypothetical protein
MNKQQKTTLWDRRYAGPLWGTEAKGADAPAR